MTPDHIVTLHDTACEELHAIWALEQREGRDFVMPYTMDRHRTEFARPEILYKSIHHGAHFVGFVILALDPDGVSVELRRIVVSSHGRGIGRRAVELVRDLCKRALGRGRVWLDVF
jgi:RimJ/RimL family protein N-acetyltransferase